MGRPASREKRIQWSARIEAWRASGLSGREFAEREGVSRASLYMWVRTLRAEAAPRFARVMRAQASSDEGTTPSSLHIIVGAATIRVEPGFDAAHLASVVRALGGVAR